jgi:hypothetical protein
MAKIGCREPQGSIRGLRSRKSNASSFGSSGEKVETPAITLDGVLGS